MAFKVRVKGPTSVHTPSRPQFAWGSRPPALRGVRIKPMASQVQYGKNTLAPSSEGVSGAGFGNTDKTGAY